MCAYLPLPTLYLTFIWALQTNSAHASVLELVCLHSSDEQSISSPWSIPSYAVSRSMFLPNMCLYVMEKAMNTNCFVCCQNPNRHNAQLKTRQFKGESGVRASWQLELPNRTPPRRAMDWVSAVKKAETLNICAHKYM